MRKILAFALALVMLLGLAACGSKPAADSAPAAAPAAAPADDGAAAPADGDYAGHTLMVANWQAYNSDEDYCEKAFEDKFGCQVEHVYFNSYDELMTTLQTGGNKTIDAVVLSNNYTQYFRDAGLIATVDPAKIPSYAEIAEAYKDLKPFAVDDAGNVFAFPWCSGTSSLAYNPDYVDHDLEHWSDLLDPSLTGHVMVLDSDGDDWVLGCILSGQDSDYPETVDTAAMNDALMQLKGQLLGLFGSNDEQIQPWLSGDFWAGEIWSGPYSQLMDNPDTNIKLVHPTEGTVAYIDYWAVVEGTDEFDLACEWINWIESSEHQYVMATGVSEDYPAADGGLYSTYTPVNAVAASMLTDDQLIRLELDPAPTKLKLLPYVADPAMKDEWNAIYQNFAS